MGSRLRIARVVLRLALALVPTACVGECGPCGDRTATFPIVEAQAIEILDIHGQPQPDACRRVCTQLADGGLFPPAVDGCAVVSSDAGLAVACAFALPCAL